MITRPNTSQTDRDALEDNGLSDTPDKLDEPVLLHHDERTAT